MPSLPLCVFLPQFVCPAHLFSLSQIKFPVPIFPLVNTNIYSNICVYLLESLLAGNDDVFFSCIIVSCRLKPASINFNACLTLLPDSLPLIVASPTTQTTIHQYLTTLYRSTI